MMRALIAGLCVVCVLGAANSSGQVTEGNRAVAHHAGGRRAAIGTRAPIATEHAIEGFEAIEPTLGFTEDGTLFYTAMASNTDLDVVRSTDGGRTWEEVSPELPGGAKAHTVGLDPYLYVDPATSRVFTIDLTVACSYLSFSDDRGGSWTTNPLGCGRPINDHQTLFAGPPVDSPTIGYPNVIYYCFNDLATSSCTKSLDGGVTFVSTGEPAFALAEDGSAECGGLHGHGVVDHGGVVYLPREFCGKPYLAISRDEGRSWERMQIDRTPMPSQVSDPSVAVDGRGNIYYAWIPNDRLPHLSISTDGGSTWSKPMMIAAPGVTEANLLTLAVGRPGSVAFAYVGSDDSAFQECRKDSKCKLGRDGPPRWHAYVGQTTNALGRHPLFYSATVNDKRDPIVRGGCGPGRCAPLIDFIDMTVSPAGEAWASFVDGVEGGKTGLSNAFVGRLSGGPRLR